MKGPNLLATIVAATRRSVAVRQERIPLANLERRIERTPNGEGFGKVLCASPSPRVIAECKRRSPSRGILRASYDAASHAAAYERAGAAAISVLTEPTFFDGSAADLTAVRAAVRIPLLRKDFIVTEYQLVEAAVLGADAVLLIVGALRDAELRGFLLRAEALGLAALVEVHDDEELRRACDAGAGIVGVNSRNLRTLSVERGVLDGLARLIPEGIVAVAESGLRDPQDLRRLTALGYDAFLVGERLITHADPGAALAELKTGCA